MIKLIDNAAQCHQLWSVRLAVAVAVLNAGAAGWTLFQGIISPLPYACVNMALGVGVAIARVVSQQSKDDPQ